MKLYIPLWYDSNCKGGEIAHIQALLYIPLWYDSNRGELLPLVCGTCLYIPLWYDSNALAQGTVSLIEAFTFHSGTILMHIGQRQRIQLGNFTFHSGTILIRPLFYYRNTLFSSTVLSTSNFILYFASMKL